MPRKPVKKTTKKVAPVATPETHECHCGDGCHCGCHHGKFKKFIVLLIVFLLGFAVAKFTCCHRGHSMHHGPRMRPVFQNGCLDMAAIKCPKMKEALQVSVANEDGCITVEEFKEIKHAMREEMRMHHGPKPIDAE